MTSLINDTATRSLESVVSQPSAMATRYLWLYLSPCLLVIGIVGNILILVTMSQRSMRGTSTYVYLVSMAVSDLCVLVFGLIPDWLEGAEVLNVKEVHPSTCKLHKFSSFLFGDAAVWIRVLFTVDRSVAVSKPLYSGCCCGNVSSAIIYVVCTFLVSIAKNLHLFWTRGAQYMTPISINSTDDNVTHLELISNCGYPLPIYKHFESKVRPWLAFIVVSIVPFIMIATCNYIIISALVRRHRLFKGRRGVAALVRLSSTVRESDKQHQLFQVAAMCVAASTSFLLCTGPSIVLLIGKGHWKGAPAYEMAKAINNQLYYVMFAANFFLYCLTAARFRNTLMTAILCRKQLYRLNRHGGVRARQVDTYSRSNSSVPMTENTLSSLYESTGLKSVRSTSIT